MGAGELLTHAWITKNAKTEEAKEEDIKTALTNIRNYAKANKF